MGAAAPGARRPPSCPSYTREYPSSMNISLAITCQKARAHYIHKRRRRRRGRRGTTTYFTPTYWITSLLPWAVVRPKNGKVQSNRNKTYSTLRETKTSIISRQLACKNIVKKRLVGREQGCAKSPRGGKRPSKTVGRLLMLLVRRPLHRSKMSQCLSGAREPGAHPGFQKAASRDTRDQNVTLHDVTDSSCKISQKLVVVGKTPLKKLAQNTKNTHRRRLPARLKNSVRSLAKVAIPKRRSRKESYSSLR